MKKQRFRIISFSLICLSIPVMASAQVVFIPDFNLRGVIQNKLGKVPGTTITVADIARITDLDGTNRNIHNLTGLEHATNLIRLWLPENNITDLRPLAGLTQLEELALWTNSISNLRPLAGLINLRGLYLRNNYISDLSPLAGLTRLRDLNLGENRIFNISSLAGLTQLEKLVLRTNSISYISPLARLINLRLLDLGENSISDISALAGLFNLTELWIDNNSISDISPLVANTGLRNGDKLNLRGNPLSDLSFNSHIPTLQSRGVNVEFDILAAPVNIPDPNLQNAIKQVLGKARGATITVADMERLTVFDAPSRHITNLTGLEHATNLKELGLARNNITDISPLARLNNLTVLVLAVNSITDISPLAGLTNLRLLDLGENSISDISALAGLFNLTELWIGNNSISDISPLVTNTGLRNGDKLNLRGNPLSDLSFNSYIPTLQSRGVNVELYSTAVQSDAVSIPDPNLRNAVEQVLRKARGATITVADMATLQTLYATRDDISNLTGLEYATNLRELGLEANSISDISPLAGLTNLLFLHLRNNSISNISPLSRLTRLIFLHIGTNRISDISPLAGLNHLTALGAGHNNITDISPLARLNNLARIGLHNNSISDISPLAGLTQLTELHLHNNSISDLLPLVINMGLGRGDTVDVDRNPLSNLSINIDIPILQSRGVNVRFGQVAGQRADVNNDGNVNIFDLVLVASKLGTQGQNLAADVNGDGIVNILDLVLVAGMFDGAPAAPAAEPRGTLTAAEVQGWLTDARSLEIKDPIAKRGIMVLEQLLLSLTPTETELLANYPNPFNPETWIPYRLAEDAFVTLTIYDEAGQVVRTLDVGHQIAAVYENRSKAIYWNGRNQVGELVASGVYFYHLSAGDYSATRETNPQVAVHALYP